LSIFANRTCRRPGYAVQSLRSTSKPQERPVHSSAQFSRSGCSRTVSFTRSRHVLVARLLPVRIDLVSFHRRRSPRVVCRSDNWYGIAEECSPCGLLCPLTAGIRMRGELGLCTSLAAPKAACPVVSRLLADGAGRIRGSMLAASPVFLPRGVLLVASAQSAARSPCAGR